MQKAFFSLYLEFPVVLEIQALIKSSYKSEWGVILLSCLPHVEKKGLLCHAVKLLWVIYINHVLELLKH